MTDPTLPTRCLRLFSHGPHDTLTGRCEGVTGQQRTAQLAERAAEARAELHSPASTECPHAGCVHDAATPDAAHHMDPGLVASLQAMAAHHGPRGLRLALEALWPDEARTLAVTQSGLQDACQSFAEYVYAQDGVVPFTGPELAEHMAQELSRG